MRKLKFYICKVLYYVYKFLGMSLNHGLIENEIRSGISSSKYNKYGISINVSSVDKKDNDKIDVVLEYPPQEITTITLSDSNGDVIIDDVNSNPKSQLDYGRIYHVIENIIDDMNHRPISIKNLKDKFKK